MPDFELWAELALREAEARGDRPSGVRRLDLPDAPFEVAAKLGRGAAWKRRARARLGLASRSERAWRVARELEAAGVLVPRALGWVRSSGSARDVYLAEWIDAPSLTDRLRRRSEGLAPTTAGSAEAWVRIAGAAVAALHSAAATHRDLKAANLLARDRDGALEILITDLDGARKRAAFPPFRRRARDLGRLRSSLEALGAQTHVPLLLQSYLAALGRPGETRALDAATARYAAAKRSLNARRGRPLE